MKRQVTVIVYNQEQYDSSDWPPEEAEAFVAWFQHKLAGIPAEYRPSTIIELNARTRYDDYYPGVTIGYTRPETDAEETTRKANERQYKDRQKARELEQLAALKAKYEKA